jgi:hypothetical protein
VTFTYDATLSTDLSKIRLEIGDTVEQDYSLTDEEIAVAQAETPNSILRAAVRSFEWRLARLMDWIAQSAGGQSKSLNQKYDQAERQYKRLKARLRKVGGVNIYAGGISESRITDSKEDSDYPQPFARVGQDDIDDADDNDVET